MARENILSDLNKKYAEMLRPNTVIIVVAMTIGVFGNVVVMLLYGCRIKDKKGVKYFIPFLAFIDCLGSITACSMFIVSDTLFYTYPSEILCKFLMTFSAYLSQCSAQIILAFTIQTYLFICRPCGQQLTLRRRRVCLIVIGILSFAITAPTIKTSGVQRTNTTYFDMPIKTSICILGHEPSLLHSLFYGGVLFLMFTNICLNLAFFVPIIRTIRNSLLFRRRIRDQQYLRNTHAEKEDGDPKNISYIKNEIIKLEQDFKATSCARVEQLKENETMLQISRMYFVVVLAFVLSYSPTLIIIIVSFSFANFGDIYTNMSEAEINAWSFFSRAYLWNHVVNPFIYGYFDNRLRKELVRYCCCKRGGKQQSGRYSVNKERAAKEMVEM